MFCSTAASRNYETLMLRDYQNSYLPDSQDQGKSKIKEFMNQNAVLLFAQLC